LDSPLLFFELCLELFLIGRFSVVWTPDGPTLHHGQSTTWPGTVWALYAG
jgi:hypothetical protein